MAVLVDVQIASRRTPTINDAMTFLSSVQLLREASALTENPEFSFLLPVLLKPPDIIRVAQRDFLREQLAAIGRDLYQGRWQTIVMHDPGFHERAFMIQGGLLSAAEFALRTIAHDIDDFRRRRNQFELHLDFVSSGSLRGRFRDLIRKIGRRFAAAGMIIPELVPGARRERYLEFVRDSAGGPFRQVAAGAMVVSGSTLADALVSVDAYEAHVDTYEDTTDAATLNGE